MEHGRVVSRSDGDVLVLRQQTTQMLDELKFHHFFTRRRESRG
jgi:hypothetical protein